MEFHLGDARLVVRSGLQEGSNKGKIGENNLGKFLFFLILLLHVRFLGGLYYCKMAN